jgi:hypothetical protein
MDRAIEQAKSFLGAGEAYRRLAGRNRPIRLPVYWLERVIQALHFSTFSGGVPTSENRQGFSTLRKISFLRNGDEVDFRLGSAAWLVRRVRVKPDGVCMPPERVQLVWSGADADRDSRQIRSVVNPGPASEKTVDGEVQYR